MMIPHNMVLVFAIINGVVLGCVTGLMAMGLSLPYRITGIFNFAWPDYAVLSAFLLFYLLNTVQLQFSLLYALGVVCAVMLVAAFTVASAEFVLKPLYGRGLVAPVIATIGLGFALRYGIAILSGPESRFATIPHPGFVEIASTQVSILSLGVIVIAVGSYLLLELIIFRTDFGTRLRAYSANPDLSEVRGIDTEMEVRKMWFLMGGLIALAGVVIMTTQSISPWMGSDFLPIMFAAVIIGGVGSFRGAFYGSILTGVMIQLITVYAGNIWGLIVTYFVIIGVLFVYPEGLENIWASERRADIT